MSISDIMHIYQAGSPSVATLGAKAGSMPIIDVASLLTRVFNLLMPSARPISRLGRPGSVSGVHGDLKRIWDITINCGMGGRGGQGGAEDHQSHDGFASIHKSRAARSANILWHD